MATFLRVEQFVVEVAASYTPKASVSQFVIEVAANYNPKLVVNQFIVEVGYVPNTTSSVRNSLTAVEALVQYTPKLRLGTLTFSVLGSTSSIWPTKQTLTFTQSATYTLGSPIINESASSTLSLVSTASGAYVANRSASDTVSFTQTAVGGLLYSETASSTLVLTDTADYDYIDEETQQNTLSFISTADYDLIAVKSANSTLTITQSLTVIHVILRDITDTLTLTQDQTGSASKRPGDSFLLTQVVALTKVINKSITQVVAFNQALAIHGTLRNTASDSLTLNSNVSLRKVLHLSASSTLAITDSNHVQKGPFGIGENIISFAQSATAQTQAVNKSTDNELTIISSVDIIKFISPSSSSLANLTQTATYDFIGNRIYNDTLTFRQSAIGVVVEQKQYLILQAPFESLESTIVLPNPLLDDAEGLTGDITVRRSMNGAVRTYVKRNKSRRLKYTLSLTRSKGLELANFIIDHNSDKIRLQNWKGEIWKVNLITNPTELVYSGRAEPDGPRVEINLEFEGIRVT